MKLMNISLATLTVASVGAYKVYDVKLKASWTTTTTEPSVKWDFNWDRRDPKFLIKQKGKQVQKKSDLTCDEHAPKAEEKQEDAKTDQEVDKKTTKARRHLILIRHGQYHVHAKEPDQKTLTALGEEQAIFVGKRLSEVYGHRKIKLVHSTMIRAIQTADLIKGQLNLEKIESVHMDDILKEGAPIPPEPPVGHWKPEYYVKVDFMGM